ncbi:MAG: hypothetical protein ACRELY_05920 [Polyangiaceae bacterium]
MSRVLLLACAALLTACSSSSSAPADAPDSGTSDQGDAGGFVPADHPAPPTVVKGHGSVLATPKIVVVTFGSDPLASQIEAFASQVGASQYWNATTSEYGVGPIAFGGAVHLDAPPAATISIDDLESWLVSELDGTHADWPAADPSAIYTIVYPKAPGGIQVDGAAPCQSSPAYHYEVKLGSGVHVPYAAINRCDPIFGLSGIDYVTAGLSHEWIEASTDPLYASAPAYASPKSADWLIVTGGELADMCTTMTGVYFKPDDLPFTVQRSWSNAAATAGHDPCVPAAGGPYFAAAPVLADQVRGKYYGGAFSSDGAKVAVGASTTIEVDLFSDDATDAWNVVAAPFGGAKLQFSWDAESGSNGDKLHLTVTRVADSADISGASLFTITSTSGSKESVWIGAVGD